MELDGDERLALLAAIDKRVAPLLRQAKDDARAALMEACERDGTDRRAVRVGGEKVGEVGVSYAPAHPAIIDMGAALESLRPMGLVVEAPAKGWEEHFTTAGGAVVAKESGEIADWAVWEPKRPKGAAVRGCAPEDVLGAFGARLGGDTPFALLDGVQAGE